jgi:bla regulator protein blaR1
MSALFVYLIKVNIALIIFCLGYYLVLRPLTFYVLNRVYLVSAILFATLYPLIDFEAILNRHQEIAQPVQIIIVNWQAPVVEAVHDKWYWMSLVFWTGVGVLAVRFIMQLLSLYKLHRQSKPVQLHQYFIRVISGDVNPFSFWRSIYVNPENHRPEELKAILAHEQVHVSEWHTIDILLGEISAIFYWFNPGVWLMKRAIRENIEFITDQKILQSGSDPKTYQYSLLNVSFSGGHNAIVNHFNTSTIKKRIMMMNAKRSSTLNLTRYALLVPAVVALILVFSVSKAEFKKQVSKSNAAIAEAFTTVIEKIEPVTSSIAGVAQRSVDLLPDAVHVMFTDSVKKQMPVKSLLTFSARDTTYRSMFRIEAIQDTSSRNTYTFKIDTLAYRDTSKKLKEITVRGYGVSKKNSEILNPIPGDVISPDGNIYFNGGPINKAMINGVVVTPHKMTPEEMEKLKQAGTATIYPGGVIDISQQKVTKVKVNGVEMTSTSEPISNKSIQVENLKNLSIDKDGAVHVSGKNLTYKDKDAVVTTQGFAYNPNVINIKRPVDTPKINVRYLGKDPLIIVNGIPGGNFNDINLNDIETVNVLKDGSASIYGKRGENGVIVVTTRRDRSGLKPITVPGRPLPTTTTSILGTTSRPSAVTVYGYGNSTNLFAGKLLIVDGKETSLADFSKIPADKIEVVKKGGAKELKKYGSKAKNGVLIITTNR